MFPFSRDAKDDPSANAPAAPAPAPAHPLDVLTGGVFSAATSGERAQRLRDWLASEPTQEQPLRSAEYYEQAGDVFLALSDERGLMHSYGSAGNARLAASDDVGAEQAFRQALFLCEKLDDPLVCVDLELGLSAALRGMERLKEALDSTDSCLGMLAQSPDRFLQARTMLERGRILGLQDDRAAALDAMVQAWELFGKDGRMEQQAAMATELIEAAQQAGRNDLVQRYRQLRSELNVSS